MNSRLLLGDCREVLSTIDADSVHACVTDPPYELGFMGKAWDRSGVAFDPETWAAVYRVLKPGAHLLAFGGTRTVHRIACAIEDAGFEIRDQIAWLYGSGFPKSHNLSGDWDGWGTALKPASEPIVVARKPFRGTVASNVTEHGTGAINVNACRIEGTGNKTFDRFPGDRPRDQYRTGTTGAAIPSALGRWPANVVLDEEAGAVLDAQTGTLSSNSGKAFRRGADEQRNAYGKFAGNIEYDGFYGDSGGASRFFYCAKADRTEREIGMQGAPMVAAMRYGEKAQGPLPQQSPLKPTPQGNHHPTVKPIALMQWLVRLVTPPGGTVLDPFLGSGTTGIAASREGFGFVGIELSPDYLDIARRRIHGDAPLFADIA